VPEEPEELDFDKQSFLGPRQRTLEECLSGFSVIGDFGVALAPAKKAAEGKATVPGKIAVKAGQVKTVAKSAVKKPVPKATPAPTARAAVASAPNAVGARPIAPGSGKPRALASGPKAAPVQPSKRTR
jgi:hypothetical protein